MNLKLAVENALINTYRHIKIKPGLKQAEIAGLFINFYYQQAKTHAGLCVANFSIIRQGEKIILFAVKESSWNYESKELKSIFDSMRPSDFYALYLRSSFENPNQDYYGQSEVRNVISVEHYIKEKAKEEESLII